jgi:glycosyltransferase involved in cell wall biosynthesis
VVDDGSTDGSLATIERYGRRVRAICQPNGGQGSAIDVGFAQSSGDEVMFVDSDDALCPRAIECVVSVLADPAVAKVHWQAAEIDEAGCLTGLTVPRHKLSRGDLRQRVLTCGPYGYHWPPTSANAWSRRVLERILPMPERSFRTCPDLYLAALAPLYGLIECIDAPLSLWRKHAINYSWREDFATRVQEGIDRDEVTMNAVAQHARRLGLVVDRANWRANAWWKQIGAAISDIVAVVPEGDSFILADHGDWASGHQIAGRTPVPFLDRGGVYWGPPTDDADAILELHRQRERGLRFFAVAFPHLWYLDYYRGLRDWLRTHAREHVHNDRVAIFEFT